MRIYREGDEGAEVIDIQQRLAALGLPVPAGEVGRFGSHTLEMVRSFQGRRNLRVDGLVGPDTWGQLTEAGFRLGDRTLYLHAQPMRGDDVRDLQHKLNALGFDSGKEDGVHGIATDRAVREFQHNVGEVVDGVVGLHTIEIVERMRPIEGVPGRALVREAEQLRQMHASLEGQTVAIDPGGAPVSGSADDTLALAHALADELAGAGAKPMILRGPDEDPPPGERARRANELGAVLCIALQVAMTAPPGPTCASFGNASTHSPAGEHLAGLILEELCATTRTGGRLERLTVSLLRETRMPAVLVDPSPLVPIDDASRERIARAVAFGAGRFFREHPAND